MTEYEIQSAVEGVMALRPVAVKPEATEETRRALKRRYDEIAFARELEAIERDDMGIPMTYEPRNLFGIR
ncbi:hypothetical protein [Vibrio vulnificus]|uniref:hypothetical protein n=1 Tax=Vibrio vulnificus TaxID=672 RepID=UPI000500915C|nr:hypothetical protein [Vibrio vulnificus]KFK48632.1 hypothetical protein JS87_20480 [Vibrio vulnificus]KFK53094.1 hypothetical protein JS86_21830 [Vibrio vulnificus]KFK66623.1 hypothetical protein JS85_24985 [Vibrio vulnificus]